MLKININAVVEAVAVALTEATNKSGLPIALRVDLDRLRDKCTAMLIDVTNGEEVVQK